MFIIIDPWLGQLLVCDASTPISRE